MYHRARQIQYVRWGERGNALAFSLNFRQKDKRKDVLVRDWFGRPDLSKSVKNCVAWAPRSLKMHQKCFVTKHLRFQLFSYWFALFIVEAHLFIWLVGGTLRQTDTHKFCFLRGTPIFEIKPPSLFSRNYVEKWFGDVLDYTQSQKKVLAAEN